VGRTDADWEHRLACVGVCHVTRTDERKSGEAHRAFLEAAIAKPYIVGKRRCTYIDDIPTRDYRRPGLLRNDESAYIKLIELTAEANRHLLAKLYETVKAPRAKTGK